MLISQIFSDINVHLYQFVFYVVFVVLLHWL